MKKMIVSTAVVVLMVAVTSPSASAAPAKPTISWKVSTLSPSTTVSVASLAKTNSPGKKTWQVSGSCSLSKQKVKTKASGTCTVKLVIASTSIFTAASSSRRLSIKKKDPVIVPQSIDPYEGALEGTTTAGVTTVDTMETPDGRTRHYRVYVPASLPAGQVPLMVALHGGLGTSSQFEANSGFSSLAESNGFIVVYPDGIGNQPDGTGFQTWNGGYCCGPAQTANVDDVLFIRQLVALLVEKYPVDSKRIWASGHSNGGILAYRLACEMSDVITAIGFQAGSNVVAGCNPQQPVSVLHIHGTSDTNMPIDGGKGSGLSATIFVSAQSAVDAMVNANGCATTAVKGVVPSNPDLSISTWSRPTGGIDVRFIKVTGATHAWMGHPSQSPNAAQYVGTPYMALDSSRAIVSFLKNHPRQ